MDANGIKDYMRHDFDKIERLLESIGCHKIWESSRGREVRCASPDGTNKTSISIKMDSLKASHYSSGEKIGTDIIGLVGHFKKYSFPESLRYISAFFGLSKGTFKAKEDHLSHFKKHKKKTGSGVKLSEIDVEKFPKTMLNNYIQLPHYELFKEGIVPQVQEQYNICYDDKLDRILFPHFSFDNKDEIVGIAGRTLASKEMMDNFDIPKYWNYIKGYMKMYNLYGFSHAIEHIKKQKCMVIFEAEKSVLKLATFEKGEGYGTAVGCHELSDVQVKIIIQLTPPDTEIVIAFDKDVMTMEDEEGKHIGVEFLEKTCKKLTPYRKVSYIYDKYDILEEKSSPIDEGIKKWEYLFKHRVACN